MEMESSITFKDVYKEFPFYQHITAGFKSFLFNLPKNLASVRKTRFVALDNVSFDIRKGETFGIIGKNGSGKSTILSLMAGVIREDRGEVKTYGKISSLLELGAGFHPDLSGMENITLNGILMGNTRVEVLEKIGRIVEFSELGDFIYQPLRTYSSGMQVRLGFSVAVHIDPEVLLIDEALAVGDLSFQDKCMRKMQEFKESGATIVIVSHDLASIAKLCDRALWIDSGSIAMIGEPKEVIMKYLSSMGHRKNFSGDEVGEDEVTAESDGRPPLPLAEDAIKEDKEMKAGSGAPLSPLSEISMEPAEKNIGVSDETACSALPSGALSWWDFPAIVGECVSRITGHPDDSFYEFLASRYMIGSHEKGLSICCRLEGIETNFMISKICRSFDVVDDEGTVERMISGSWKGNGPYDFFLCIDFLHRLKNPGAILETIANALKDAAVIVAIEYVGPPSYARSEKELKIADALCALLGDRVRREYMPPAVAFPPGSRCLTEGAISSYDVLPALKQNLNILDVRYFAGPLLDLVVDRILEGDSAKGGADSPGMELVRNIIQLEQVLIKGRILENQYAMVIAEKRSSASFINNATVH